MSPPPDDTPLSPEQHALVVQHRPIAERAADWFASRYPRVMTRDDFAGWAHLALARAARSYAEETGVPFECHARSRVEWAVWDQLRKELPHVRRLAAAAKAANEVLSRDYEREDVMNDTEEVQLARLTACEDSILAGALRGWASAARADEQVEGKQIATAIVEAAGALPERDRRVLEIHYDEERSLGEAAQEMGVSYSAVKRLHKGAIDRLAQQLFERGVVEARAR